MTGLNADQIEQLMSNPKIRATIEANIEIIKDEITNNTPTLIATNLDFNDLCHWHRRANELLGQPVAIISQ